MEANQLRIGNYVDILTITKIKIPMKCYKMIGNISFFEVHLYDIDKPFASQKEHYTVDVSDICGIPLTEEWLLKAGFEKLMSGMFFQRQILNDYTKIIIDHKFMSVEISVSGLSVKVSECKYLHQLQNLIFALTQTELQLTQNI